jgi:hypothetical protein
MTRGSNESTKILKEIIAIDRFPVMIQLNNKGCSFLL